jgi:hypothetical protein
MTGCGLMLAGMLVSGMSQADSRFRKKTVPSSPPV